MAGLIPKWGTGGSVVSWGEGFVRLDDPEFPPLLVVYEMAVKVNWLAGALVAVWLQERLRAGKCCV